MDIFMPCMNILNRDTSSGVFISVSQKAVADLDDIRVAGIWTEDEMVWCFQTL